MKKKGFTLAEVLIALVIIGVIAAFTIPTLMNNSKGKQYETGLKKGIATLNQALALNYAERGSGAAEAGDDPIYLATKIFMYYMKLTPLDGLESFPGGGGAVCYGPTAQTPDGIIYCIDADNWNGGETTPNICDLENKVPCTNTPTKANAYIDVNGFEKPNKMTEDAKSPQDQYQVMIYNQKVVPFGDAASQVMYGNK